MRQDNPMPLAEGGFNNPGANARRARLGQTAWGGVRGHPSLWVWIKKGALGKSSHLRGGGISILLGGIFISQKSIKKLGTPQIGQLAPPRCLLGPWANFWKGRTVYLWCETVITPLCMWVGIWGSCRRMRIGMFGP